MDTRVVTTASRMKVAPLGKLSLRLFFYCYGAIPPKSWLRINLGGYRARRIGAPAPMPGYPGNRRLISALQESAGRIRAGGHRRSRRCEEIAEHQVGRAGVVARRHFPAGPQLDRACP